MYIVDADVWININIVQYLEEQADYPIWNVNEARILNCEMEAGILLTLGGLFGIRTGAICVVSDKAPWPGPSEIDLDQNMDQCIDIATAAMLSLAQQESP